MRILFWGTPDFAVPSLRALLGEGHDVVGVVTQPDRPAGRGRELRASPIKQLAVEEGVPVLQPERPRGEEFMGEARALGPECSVVVAYGEILGADVLDLPERGSLNVHASLLPKLRGAAPVHWAVIRGHEETGVTIMRMVEEMDAGPVRLRVREPIRPDETASELWGRLSEIGAEALIEALALLEVGTLDEEEQDEEQATYAPLLSREDARIDWALDAGAVGRWMRGLESVPGGWSTLNEREVKVYAPEPLPDRAHDARSGTVLEAGAGDDEGLVVACGAGAVRVGEVKPAGKRRMSSAAWVRGRGAEQGDRFQ